MTDGKQLTTSAGAPVGDNQNSLSVGPRGPLLLEDVQLIERNAQFNRERIPERVVHAKGAGAYALVKRVAWLANSARPGLVSCAYPYWER